MDQAPIGRTPRSNPATYTGVFDHIRRLFSQTQEAKVRGYLPGRFSFNVKGGRCEACSGDGTIRIEMHFLPDIYVPCEVCQGARYNRDTLEVTFRGKTIADVLELSCEEALAFFAHQPPIARHLQTLVDVGLGYIRLGQPAPTLSGGEAQRVKLASELSRRSTGHTLYVLDEPTTGLHFDDVRKLLDVLSRLVDQGNTVIVIEHNLDVVKSADWIIDLGPEGGDRGGTVVAEGTPEEVAAVAGSYTGEVLAPLLGIKRQPAAAGGPAQGQGGQDDRCARRPAQGGARPARPVPATGPRRRFRPWPASARGPPGPTGGLLVDGDPVADLAGRPAPRAPRPGGRRRCGTWSSTGRPAGRGRPPSCPGVSSSSRLTRWISVPDPDHRARTGRRPRPG